MRISDWSSDVCSSDLLYARAHPRHARDGGHLARQSGDRIRCSRLSIDLRFAALGIGDRRGGPGRDTCRGGDMAHAGAVQSPRSEEHTSELQSLMRISYAVFCLKKKKNTHKIQQQTK